MQGAAEDLLQCVEARVTPEMNNILLKEFSDEEIKLALESIGNLKAPGDDGCYILQKFLGHNWG